MMKFLRVLIPILLISSLGFAQLKSDLQKTNVARDLKFNYANNTLFGFLDPSKMDLHHSFSMSYMTMGKMNAMVNMYMNNMSYRFSDKWMLLTRLGIMNSPYNSLPQDSYINDTKLFGGAELRFMPSEKTMISLSFDSLPYYYPMYYSGYYSPFQRQ
jgi:hypothetical protein